MKLDIEFIKNVARRELQFNIADPVEATIRGLEAWLALNELEIVKRKEWIYDHSEVQAMEEEFKKDR